MAYEALVRPHPHCCGGQDVEGLNRPGFSPAAFIRSIATKVPSYTAPHRGLDTYRGMAFFNLVQAVELGVTAEKEKIYDAYRLTDRQHKRRFKRMYDLKKYIEKYDLGQLVIGEECGNTNYGGRHRLLPAVFTPNNVNLHKFAVKRKWLPKPKKASTHNSSVYFNYLTS